MREVVSFFKIQTIKANGEVQYIEKEFETRDDAEKHISLHCDRKPIIVKTKVVKLTREIDGVNLNPKRRKPESNFER